MRRRHLLLGSGALAAGCASPPPAAEDWHAVPLPGKARTEYRWELKEGRQALAAQAEGSASLWRRRLLRPPEPLGEVTFSWWVDQLIAEANLTQAERADSPARLLLGFGGDVSRLPQRTRLMYELAEALTGEAPPYATLMYVWANGAPLESVLISPRSDRVRKIVVDTGSNGLGCWRDHRRALAADFRRAFGEDPGPLRSVAVMTDADNTRSRARAWYGPIRFV
ncbi:MAG: DUF3047 domain-containing protein [Rubrivivax sp.]